MFSKLLQKAGLLVASVGLIAGIQMLIATVAAADTLAKIQESQYIVMGSYNEPPHNWVEPAGGGYKGIDYELAETILKNTLGVETIHQIPVDWAGLIPGLVAGRWEMLAVGQAITEKRKEVVDFTNPIYRYGWALLVPKGNPKGIKGASQFPGLKLGAILGATTADYIQSIEGAELVAYKTHPEMVADLVAGRIDAALAGETTAAYAQTVSPAPIEFVQGWEGYEEQVANIGFSFRKTDPELRGVFNKELDKLKADGTLARILQKYGLSEANIAR